MYQQLLLIGMMIIALFAIILGDIIIEAIHIHKTTLPLSIPVQLKVPISTRWYSANAIESDHTDLGDGKVYKIFIKIPNDAHLSKSSCLQY